MRIQFGRQSDQDVQTIDTSMCLSLFFVIK